MRERIRSALAEGEFKALLRTPYGDRYDIPSRMWDKEPVDRKVNERFVDGRMRMHLEGPERVVGPVGLEPTTRPL